MQIEKSKQKEQHTLIRRYLEDHSLVESNIVSGYYAAIQVQEMHNCSILNNILSDCNYGIRLYTTSASTYNLISANIFENVSVACREYSGQPHDYNDFINNKIINSGGISIIGTHDTVRDNIGFVTENSGTATLANGTTSITVNHGLDVTPSDGDIIVTPTGAWGAMTKFWVGGYTSTQFTIYADQDPGQNVTFAWKAAAL